jgi:diguanylate cyclase (GGDEF)-like protein
LHQRPIKVLLVESDREYLDVLRGRLGDVRWGAQDYLVKDEVSAAVLGRAVRHAIERHQLLSALRSLSLIDDLTGLYNRRGFTDLGEQHLKLARRTARGVAVVFLDLDRFKTINDSLGHHVGDRALQKVADILRATFRRSDIIARLGGDEFAVLALEASGESAEALVDRLRERFREFSDSTRESYRLGASIGMARHDGDLRMRLEDLLAEADTGMYREKRDKRDMVAR